MTERTTPAPDGATTVRFRFRGADITLTGIASEIAQVRRLIGDYECPDWCEREDHDADVVDDEFPPLHYAPFIADTFLVQAMGTEKPYAYLDAIAAEQHFDASQMRAIAGEALKVAEWLEAHQ